MEVHPIHSSVGGDGTTSGNRSGQQLLSLPKPQSDSGSVAAIRENEEGRHGPVLMDTAPCGVIDRQGRAGEPAVLPHSLHCACTQTLTARLHYAEERFS